MPDPETSSHDANDPNGPMPDRGSPVPGCLILAAIVTIFGGLIVLYVVVGTYQYRKIGTFAQDTPAELAIAAPSPAQVEAAMGKLKAIETAVANKQAERILFTAEDLNVLIATLAVAEGFRGNTRVESIGAKGIVTAMAQPMRKGPFQKGFRYLNANFLLQPELRARTVAFKVIGIDPVIGEVPVNTRPSPPLWGRLSTLLTVVHCPPVLRATLKMSAPSDRRRPSSASWMPRVTVTGPS